MTVGSLSKVKKHDAGKVKADDAEIAKLPMVVQVLLEQIQKAPKSERQEIHGRLARYLVDFTQKDVPASATEALNGRLAALGLQSVTSPPSANVAAFRLLVERERSVTTSYSSHTNRDEPLDPSRIAARHRAIDMVVGKVGSLGASLTNEELKDAARILELAIRFAPA